MVMMKTTAITHHIPTKTTTTITIIIIIIIHPSLAGTGRPCTEKWRRVGALNQNPIGLLAHILLQLLQGSLQLLQLRLFHLLHRPFPPALLLARPSQPVQLLPSLLLHLQLARHLRQLHVQLPDTSVPVSLDELHRPGVLWRVSGQEPLHHRLYARVPEGEHLSPRREDDDRYVSAAQRAELAGFLEEAGPAF